MLLSICFPAALQPEIAPLQARLASITGWAPVLLPCGDSETVIELWDEARDSAAALIVLTPANLPPCNRPAWGDLLLHVEASRHPPVAFLEWSPSSVPASLRRAPWFSTNEFRALDAWLIAVRPDAQPHRFLASALPDGRLPGSALETLAQELVDRPGRAEADTDAAQAFSRQSAAQFLDVSWFSAAGRTEAALLDDLVLDFGLDCSLDSASAWVSFGQALDQCRCLVVLHEAGFDGALALSPSQRGSLLVAHDTIQAAPSVSLSPEAAALLESCTLFRPGRIPAHAAAQATGLPDPPLDELVLAGWLVPLERGYYRLAHALLPAADIELRRRFLDLAYEGLLDDVCLHDWMPEAVAGFEFALDLDWPFAGRFAERAATVLERQRRFREATLLWSSLLEQATLHGDTELQHTCTRELGWLTGSGGLSARPVEFGEQQSFDFG